MLLCFMVLAQSVKGPSDMEVDIRVVGMITKRATKRSQGQFEVAQLDQHAAEICACLNVPLVQFDRHVISLTCPA